MCIYCTLYIKAPLIFEPANIIIDSLEETAEYIVSATEFVHRMAKQSGKSCPFQVKLYIIY